MRKHRIILAVVAACAFSGASSIALADNLLPNGSFDTIHGSSGWTNVGTGTVAFDNTRDAASGALSGSLRIHISDAQSACFPVVSGATYQFGGASRTENSLGSISVGNMVCTAFADNTCSGSGQALGNLEMPGEFPSFGNYQTSGQLPADARAVNCDLISHDVGNLVAPSASMNFDNVFFTSTAPPPKPVTLDGYMSGNWYDPAQGGEGFQLEFTDQGQTLLAIWFTYAPSGGAQKWIFAQGPYDLTKASVTIPAQLLDAPAFPPQFDPGTVTRTPWGTLTFTFTDCDHGSVSWNSTVPGYGSGSMSISRLTRIAGTSCPQ